MKFDGKNLKDGSKTVANVKNDRIYEGHSTSKTLANVKGDRIYEGHSTSKTLGKMKDVDKAISGGGSGGTTKAALWVAVVR